MRRFLALLTVLLAALLLPSLALAQETAATPWWQALLQNPQSWGILLALVFGIWRYFNAKAADDFQAHFNEVVGIAYHATEESKRLGQVGKGGSIETFLGLFTSLMKQRGQGAKLTPEVTEAALATAKAMNSPTAKPAATSPTLAPSAP